MCSVCTYAFSEGRVDRKTGLKYFGNLKPTETLNIYIFTKTSASVTLGTPRATVMQKLFKRKRKVAPAIRHSCNPMPLFLATSWSP